MNARGQMAHQTGFFLGRWEAGRGESNDSPGFSRVVIRALGRSFLCLFPKRKPKARARTPGRLNYGWLAPGQASGAVAV